MILKRAGHDLARRCAVAVGENDERWLHGEVFVRRAGDFVRRIATAHVHDRLSLLEEQRADGERLLDDATAVVAQVDHESLGALRHELRGSRFDFLRGVLVECLERDVADVIADERGVGNGGHVNDGALERQLDRLGDTRPGVDDVHRGADDAAKRVGHLVDLDVARHGHGVDLRDDVALHHATVFSRGVREHPGDDDARDAVGLLLLEQHADTAVAAADAAIELLVRLGREQLAVRVVELPDESPRGLLEDGRLFQGIDVTGRNDRQHLFEEARRRAGRRALEEKASGCHREKQQRSDSCGARAKHSNDLRRRAPEARTRARSLRNVLNRDADVSQRPESGVTGAQRTEVSRSR